MADKRELTTEPASEDRIARSEELAREALGYWHTTLRGLFALPNAAALSVSAAILYTSGLAESAVQRVEALTGRIGGELSRELVDARRATTLPEPERAKRQPSA